jgi:hypothetical protein
VLSTLSGATLGGVTFRDGDLVLYDDVANTASLVFSEDNFTSDENVDAVHMIANGHILLSTAVGAVLGGLTLRDGDVVEYDPVGGTASLFLSEDLFVSDEDIDGVHVLSDGTIILSTQDNASIGGLIFLDGAWFVTTPSPAPPPSISRRRYSARARTSTPCSFPFPSPARVPCWRSVCSCSRAAAARSLRSRPIG